jgi:endonuclease/exonuclease/phosphatase family metal-dependent hydrolase
MVASIVAGRPAKEERSVRRILGAVVSLVLVSALVSWSSAAASSESSDEAPVDLSVMSFNIFYGGDELDLETGDFCEVADGCEATFQQVVATIEASGADVVGLQEAERNTRRIGEALGWNFDERNHLISRYPLIDPPGADGAYAFVEVTPGHVVAVANLHLTSDPYGPYAVRDGASIEEVLQLEHDVRLPDIQPLLAAMPELQDQGIPLFVTGDFNSPSYLDWTQAVADARSDVPFSVTWPVTEALGAAGLHDSYRDVNPDPVTKPGFTWTPGGPESAPEGQEVMDRIDLVLASGEATTTSSKVVGEVDGPDVDIAMSPYPSDHRAVVSTFSVAPQSPAPFAAVARRRVFVGDHLPVDVHAPDVRAAKVGIRRVDHGGKGDLEAVQKIPRGTSDVRIDFDTRRLKRGAYEVVLLSGNNKVLSRSPFWLYRPGTPTSVATGERHYDVGEPIDVSWAAAPGQRADWVAVYRCADQVCEPTSEYLVWAYTDAAIEGHLEIGPDSFDGIETWPLPAGHYIVRLLVDDSFIDLATSRKFTIRE